MASYASYKKVHGDQMVNGTLTDNDINSNTLNNFGVKWFLYILQMFPGMLL